METSVEIDLNQNVIFNSPFAKGNAFSKIRGVNLLSSNSESLANQEKFFSFIPEEILRILVKFSNSHWEFLKAIAYSEGRLEQLIVSNPTLAYILVNLEWLSPGNTFYNSINLSKGLSLEKRKEILKKARLPATNATLILLSRINPLFINKKKLNR